MRTSFIAAFTIKTALSFPLWASPVPDIKPGSVKSITRLLERSSLNSSSSVSYHFACQTSTGEYGLEVLFWDSRSYCKYLSSDNKEKMSEEFTPLHLDEEALYDSIDDFLQENKGLQDSYWEFEENALRFIHNTGKCREHILLPRDAMSSTEPGAGFDESGGMSEPEVGVNIDVGATIVGAGLVVVALTVIGIFIGIACREDMRNLIKKPALPVSH